MNGKFRSIEEIFDWCLKCLEVKSNRKPIQRLKNGSQKVGESKLVFNDFIDDILELLKIRDKKQEYLRDVLKKFIEVYRCFTLYVEPYQTSQKQLDFLVAKDMLIPFFALFSSLVFDKHLIILKQIKPDENGKSFQKFLEWSGKNICQQEIKKYLNNKYKSDGFAYDTIRKSVNSWLDLKKQTIPKKEYFEKVVQYLDDCQKAPHLNLHNLALFSKLFQAIHKEMEKAFEREEIELLIEHYYCLLNFYLKQQSSSSIEETEYRIYNELLRHIDPTIINRNFYFNENFAWLQKLVNRDHFTPYKLVKKMFDERNMIFYRLPEEECMKYIKTSLPVLYFNKSRSQKEYFELLCLFGSNLDNLEKDNHQEHINLLAKLFFKYLDIKREKNLDDKITCNKIFKNLENEFKQNDINAYIYFLKTRYFIFDNNPIKALTYCRRCIELSHGKLGEHFKEAVMTGILLSAKNNSKRQYDFFRKIAIKNDTLFFERLKVPAYGRSGTLIDIPDNKENFERLQSEYDDYFSNRFENKNIKDCR